jgi:hypothetical protein
VETAILAQNALQCCHLLLKFVATANPVAYNYKGAVSVFKARRNKADKCEHITAHM